MCTLFLAIFLPAHPDPYVDTAQAKPAKGMPVVENRFPSWLYGPLKNSPQVPSLTPERTRQREPSGPDLCGARNEPEPKTACAFLRKPPKNVPYVSALLSKNLALPGLILPPHVYSLQSRRTFNCVKRNSPSDVQIITPARRTISKGMPPIRDVTGLYPF
jgi:hypothetical protein